MHGQIATSYFGVTTCRRPICSTFIVLRDESVRSAALLPLYMRMELIMRFIGVSAALLSVLATTMAVQAVDFPVKSQRIMSAPDRSGFYASIDGSQQTVNLPTYDLGWKLRNFGPEVGLGPSETYNPRVNGYGLSGALGYVVPDGTFSSFWGESVRFEIKAAYTHAEGTAAGRGPNNDGFAAQLLDGSFGETNGFGPASGVHTWSTLATDYSAWNVSLKVAADHRMGALTLTPSLTVFGGHANNDQRFFQELGTGPGPGSRNYRAASSVQWMDWGAKLGLDGKLQITDWLNVGLGGNIGTAFRDVSMSANRRVQSARTVRLHRFFRRSK